MDKKKQIVCIHDISTMLDKWNDENIPPYETMNALIMTIAGFANEQDEPFKAIAAVVQSLMDHFYKMHKDHSQ